MNDKRMPSLSSLVSRKSRVQSAAAKRTAIELIAAQFGMKPQARRKENERGR